MDLKDHLGKLLSTVDVTKRLPVEAFDAVSAADERLTDHPTGSLLSTHLYAGSMMMPVRSMYLEGIDEKEIQESIEGKTPTIRSMWYEACKGFAEIAARSVRDALTRMLPMKIRNQNIASGKSDVLELPGEIAELALELAGAGGDTATRQASHEMAAVLLLIVGEMIGVEIDDGWPPIGGSAYRRFSNELIGATALYILGVCPQDRQPRQIAKKLLSKRVKELSKSEELIPDA